MGKIIFCSDLVVRVTDSQLLEMAAHAADGLDWGHAYNDGVVPEITNVTEWLKTSTDFRPAYPDGCVVRNEMSTMGKVSNSVCISKSNLCLQHRISILNGFKALS